MWTKTDTQKLGMTGVIIAIAVLLTIYFNPNHGYDFEQNGQYKEAIEAINKSLHEDRHKRNPELFVSRARNKRYLKDFIGAQEDLDKALQLKTESEKDWFPPSFSYRSIYMEMSELYVAEEKYDKALEILKKALENSPTSIVHTQIAWVYEKMNRLEESERESEKAVELARTETHGKYDPDPYEVALHERAKYYWRQNKLDQAFQDFDSAIQADSGICPGAYYGRGSMYLEKNDAGNALKDLDSAIKYAKRSDDDYFHARGLAYMKLKDYKHALSDFDKALELDSQNVAAKEAREDCLKSMP